MLAKRTSKNQVTLPKAAVRAKLAALGIGEKDVEDAVHVKPVYLSFP